MKISVLLIRIKSPFITSVTFLPFVCKNLQYSQVGHAILIKMSRINTGNTSHESIMEGLMMEATVETFTLMEVYNQTGIPQSTIRRWEEDYQLKIMRNKNNVRQYTNRDINLLLKIKSMRDEDLPKSYIKTSLEKEPTTCTKDQKSVEAIKQLEAESIENMIQETFDKLKQELIKDVEDTVKSEMEKGFAEFSESYKIEVNRRDELLTENMRLKNELKKDKKTSFLKVFS